MRLFAALPLAAAAIDRLTSLRLRLAAPADGLRWSTPEQWHITLKFLGEVEAAQAARLRAALETVALPACAITLDRLGLFAAKGILYAAAELSPPLDELYRAVVTTSAALGFSPDAKPFRPHITLARSKGRLGEKTLHTLATPQLPAFGPPIGWLAAECLLLQSTLRPEGACYTVLARLPLRSAS